MQGRAVAGNALPRVRVPGAEGGGQGYGQGSEADAPSHSAPDLCKSQPPAVRKNLL